MYILSISMGVEGGVGLYIVIGEGDRRVTSIRWALKEVRIAWRARADLVQVSQSWGSSWFMQGSRSSSGSPDLNFSNTAGSFS